LIEAQLVLAPSVVRNLPVLPDWDGSTAAQLAVVPSVVTYLPALPVWPGRTEENAVPTTYAVVAICVVLVPATAVGAVGVPVRAGLTESASVVPVPVVV
jgi:hypothetical protein